MSVAPESAVPNRNWSKEIAFYLARFRQQLRYIVNEDRLTEILHEHTREWDADPLGPWQFITDYANTSFHPGQHANFHHISAKVVVIMQRGNTEEQRALLYRVEDNRSYWIDIQDLRP